MLITLFSILYLLLTFFTIAFQIGLVLGKPWGEWTMGGYHKGVLPTNLRIGALVSILILSFFGLVVIEYTNILEINLNFPNFFKWIVIVFNTLTAIANTFTPSKKERNLWMPITIVMLFSGFWIFMS